MRATSRIGLFLCPVFFLAARSFAQSKATNPYSLFTVADAQQIAGVAVKNVPPPGGPMMAKLACNYEQANPGSGPKIQLNFILGQHHTKDVEDMAWNAKKSGAESGGKLDTQSAAGLSDEAYFIHEKVPGALSTTLLARKGNSDLWLQVNGVKTEPLAAMKEVAKKIIAQF